MTRQVNLMRPDMLPGFGRWQVPSFILGITLAVFASAVYAGYHWYERLSLQAEVAAWQDRVADSQSRLDAFRERHPNMAGEVELREENEQLKTELRDRQSALSDLSQQLSTTALGFADPLASLADYDLDGLWLTRIELRDSRDHLGLTGYTRDPGLVPRYLAQLEGSVFEGLSIGNLSIRQDENDPDLWGFTLSDSIDGRGRPEPGEDG